MTIEQLSNKLDIPVSWLQAVFEIESSNNPYAVNEKSGATGLIQFMPATAKSLGTSCHELLLMSYNEQLDYVYKYLIPYKRRFNRLIDVYLAIFFPRAIGKDSGYVLETEKLSSYRIAKWNPLYDKNKDDAIQVREIEDYFKNKFPNLYWSKKKH